MNEALTEKAEEIYYAARGLPSLDERKRFIDDACRGNLELRAAVEKMLASQSAVDKFFRRDGLAQFSVADLSDSFSETPITSDAVTNIDAEETGKTIGHYKLLQKIGEGGCGVVYMAEQEKPVSRRVALKIIKLGMDTKSVIARFEAERQALALMDHTNIARVLDAGATETGRPYFVMELVHGVRITEYCDERNLNTRQRLDLFIQVCQAIQHAHQKGIIHRDIKPSNILVTTLDGSAVPKVIDFGIAKAMEEKLTDKTLFTMYGHFIGTPAYMSPEQAQMSGMDVDTRSDIYSLGVLLYELLTGKTPFAQEELMAGGLDQLRRTLSDREPHRPSTKLDTMPQTELTVTAHRRHVEPMKLRHDLEGDLDWIAMKALEKDRNRRYQTANGLAVDVQRYLDNEPVTARPPSRLYRLQKLVRRNQTVFGAGIVVVVALMVGFGISTWMFFRERDARQRAVAAELQQSQLRTEAEDRERITQAAFSISQGKMEEADSSVSKIAVVTPSLEAESVLRALGEWHALKGQWAQAVEPFNLLLEADQKDNSWAITEDLLKAGPILIERGDTKGYERFRQAAVDRYRGTTDPVFAERTLKISLLMPANDKLMKSLEAFNVVASDSMQGQLDPNNYMAGWRCVSLALMAYRQDYTPTAKSWCEKGFSFFPNRGRDATLHVIRAMACKRLGENDEARSELATARQSIETELSDGLKPGDGPNGYWFDWLFAQILLREAKSMIETPPDGNK